jgi:hypothetical protein
MTSYIAKGYSTVLPLWKRGIKGDFIEKFNRKISPHPSFSKRGICLSITEVLHIRNARKQFSK